MKQNTHPKPVRDDSAARLTLAFDPGEIVGSTDAQLERLFRGAGTLPLERIVNSGEHRVDPARREIFNDMTWKGYLPKGLPLGELAARLSTGYAKRFWKKRNRYLGETQYLDGRVMVNHSLEEITIERRTNDIDPGKYILLRYTDPVLEHYFYDVMKAVNDNLILYRGYTGRFPEGRRGWTAPLLRSYGFGQMGVEDHRLLFSGAAVPKKDQLAGTWRMDVIANSNHASSVGHLHFDLQADGNLKSRFEETRAARGLPLPKFASDHFHLHDFSKFRHEIRKLDEQFLIGRWVTQIQGPFAMLFRTGSLGVFHAEKDRGGAAQFGMYYLLTRKAAPKKPDK